MIVRSTGSALAALGLLACLTACTKSSTASGPPTSFLVDSDPQGATIWLDGTSQNLTTPDSLRDVLAGTHTIGLVLDTADVEYQFFARTQVVADTMPPIRWPLLLQCLDNTCLDPTTRQFSAADMDFDVAPNGTLFYGEGTAAGLSYPTGTGQGYIYIGAPVSSGYLGGSTPPVGPSISDIHYYAGRPAQDTLRAPDRFQLSQRAWLLPPPQLQQYWTGRGLKIEEQVTADEAYPGVLFLRVVFRNISGDTLYQMADPILYGQAAMTYQSAYFGFAIDPDIGDSSDDYVSYVPDQNLVFAYDSDFQELAYTSSANAPALVGLEMLEAPVGTTVVMTGWPSDWDWHGAANSEGNSYAFLSGTVPDGTVGVPNYPDPRIGYAPTSPTDVRIAVTAGPVDLAAGDSVVLRVALVVAPPVAGTFQSGTVIAPGDPLDAGRAILAVAGNLIQRAQQAASRP